MAEEQVVIDPVEEALAAQHEVWREAIAEIDTKIGDEEDFIKRLRESKNLITGKLSTVKKYLDTNFEGWDVRQSERSEKDGAPARPKRG